MKIDCELTDEEQAGLAMLLGMGQGAAMQFKQFELAKLSLRVMNKLFQHSPHYTPYDETIDPRTVGYLFKRITTQ